MENFVTSEALNSAIGSILLAGLGACAVLGLMIQHFSYRSTDKAVERAEKFAQYKFDRLERNIERLEKEVWDLRYKK